MRKAKCFNDEIRRYGPYATFAAGLRVVEVNRITGSVNKCHELDHRFRSRRRRDRLEKWRRGRFDEHTIQFHTLPSIDVYQLDGEYYVIDGNRRVGAAKKFGLEFMDANVVECVPHSDKDAHRGVISRHRFEQQTGLKNIRLDQTSGYAELLQEVEDVTQGDSMFARAASWYTEVFLPRVRVIAGSELKAQYPKRRQEDLYLLVMRFYRELMGGVPVDVEFETVLSAFLFARRLSGRRMYRSFPLRQLYKLLRGRVPASLLTNGDGKWKID